jgi:hypothetical protein
MSLLGWGLIPSSATDPSIGLKTINATLETFANTAHRSANRSERNAVSFCIASEWRVTQGTAPKVPAMAAFPGPTFARASASKTSDLCRISLAENYLNSELRRQFRSWRLWVCTVAVFPSWSPPFRRVAPR